ncbi:MAG: sodium:calcium antiporter [Deltaproteobacteria bacterium]|nr:sodium:calcium antiporter [Deltaproteobacteria bacterium]
MDLWLLILYALFLLLVISVASEFLAKGAVILEHRFGSGFVGSVILGFVTMLPELIFVLVAINAGEVDIAVGSAVCGNILLFTIGYGFVIILAYVKHKEIITLKPTMRDDLWYLIISALYLLIASLDFELTLFDGIVLSLMYFVFVIHQLIESKKLGETGQTHEISRKKWLRSGSFMLFGAIAIVIAAEPFVHNITDISVEVGVSALILALIVSPFASEMPEKISAFILTKRSMVGAEMAIANFIGSKVQAGTLLFGSMILLHIFLPNGHDSLIVSNAMLQIFFAVFTTIVGVAITYDLKLKLKEGILVLVLYVITLAVMLINESFSLM